MGQPLILTGALIKLYINNKLYKEVQAISFDIDYGETEIFGIDAMYPQEIGSNRITVRGSVNGLRVKMSGGLQGVELRPLFNDASASPYVSIRVQDRVTQEDIIYIQNAKVTREKHGVVTKGTYKVSFDFSGQIPLQPLDRS